MGARRREACGLLASHMRIVCTQGTPACKFVNRPEAASGSARSRGAGAIISAETGRGSSRREPCARSEARAGGVIMDGAVGELTTRDRPIADRPAVNFTTLAEAFRVTSAERAEAIAIRTRGDEFTITWGEL